MNATFSLAPSIDQVDSWFREEMGFQSSIVGHSYRGRPLRLYQHKASATTKKNNENIRGKPQTPSLLLLSLVHGNEPMGLLALMDATKRIVKAQTNIDLLVFPIVNVDAYQLNLEYGKGCRRTNLRKDPAMVGRCQHFWRLANRGVDLNRNHPVDWEPVGDHGWIFWSEPESRAIREVVVSHKPTAAISFHSRARGSSLPLLIHPYTSTRGFASMPVDNQVSVSSVVRPQPLV